MNIKRTFLSIIGLLICVFLIFGWFKINEGGPVPYPINTGSFFTIGSAIVDPMTLLEDVRKGNEPLLQQVQSGLPEDTSFVMSIGWSQNDYLEIAQALYQVIWKDDPSNWHLYRMSFYTGCENPSGKFEDADLYYYQEVKKDGKRKYSVRAISIKPQYGYITWGGDTFYPSPFFQWKVINLKEVTVTAEKALRRAETSGGMEFRRSVENKCDIDVLLWPDAFERYDWWVVYWDDNISSKNRRTEFWVPTK